MTSPTERDMATFIAATKAADEQDAKLLLAVVGKLRTDDDLRYEASWLALEAMAKRMTERLRAAERWAERGMLEDTDVLTFAEIELELQHPAGTDDPHSAPPSAAPVPRRRGHRP